MHWLPDLVFLDIETTGATPLYDRITEIALIKIENGQKTVIWQSLLNPELPIPRNITGLTGITNDMVQNAPTFKEIAGDLFSHLQGMVLVAHNCRFDYGFLKAEFKRLGGTLRLQTLCTVKLSRKLYPDVTGHSLDVIMHRFNLHTNARHRAMGDTQLMLDFLEATKQEMGSVKVLEAINYLLKGPTLPPWLDHSFINNIQDVPGIYIFYDEGDLPLYIGKSIKLKTRVLNHFSSDHKTVTEMEVSQKVRRIECRETAGELGALLLEAKLVKQMQPVYNRLLRNVTKMYALRMSEQMNDLPWLRVISVDDVDPESLGYMYGMFKTKKAAKSLMHNLADEFKLCLKVLGIEKGGGKCFAQQVNKCSGVCVGKEKYELHHLKLRQALVKHKIKSWPYEGRIGITELNTDTNNKQIHIFEHWCHLETVNNEADFYEAINSKFEKKFDIDFYRLSQKSLVSGYQILNMDKSNNPQHI